MTTRSIRINRDQRRPDLLRSPEKRPTAKRKRHFNFAPDGYEIIDLLGQGGMGQVYKAKQKSLGRIVAIKTLDLTLASRSQAAIKRFKKEAAMMAQLHHPNIVYVIDRGFANPYHYFVMEFVDGPSLRALLQNSTFSPEGALNVMLGLARTMEYAHGQGVTHRDLKPENLLYTGKDAGSNSDGDILLKVADFGLARYNEQTTYIKNLTNNDVSMGTDYYMAPEQRIDAKNVDERADLYSMGMIFYELITGKLFKDPDECPTAPIAKGYPQIDQVIRRCLKRAPNERFRTSSEFRTALEEIKTDLNNRRFAANRDTVVDTPGVYEAQSNGRLVAVGQESEGQKKPAEPNNFTAPESYLDDLETSWKSGASKKFLWSSFVLALIALAVGVFFLVMPEPPAPIPKGSKTSFLPWDEIPVKKSQATNGGSKLTFDFAQQKRKFTLGKRLRKQWKTRGNWVAKDKKIEQNTYAKSFQQNFRKTLALYKGHMLSSRDYRVDMKVQFRKPFVPTGNTKLSLERYLAKVLPNKRHTLKKATLGIGLYGVGGGALGLVLKEKNRRLEYAFHVKGSKASDARRSATGTANATFRYNRTLQVSLRVKGQKASIWIDGKKMKEHRLKANESFPAHLGLSCRNAHCQFANVRIQSSRSSSGASNRI